jgi:hypothetical protein
MADMDKIQEMEKNSLGPTNWVTLLGAPNPKRTKRGHGPLSCPWSTPNKLKQMLLVYEIGQDFEDGLTELYL